MRIALIVLGWLFVSLAVIGIVVPLIPTFDFLLLASLCFAKSSPRFEKWLTTHRTFGPPLRAWKEERSISRKHKVYATTMIAICVGVLVFGFRFSGLIDAAIVAFASLLVQYILSRKTRLPNGPCPLRALEMEGEAHAELS
jgi:uncharacterized membrane protein YbaN (DUF454 family)